MPQTPALPSDLVVRAHRIQGLGDRPPVEALLVRAGRIAYARRGAGGHRPRRGVGEGWLRGIGWDVHRWGRMPTRQELDAVAGALSELVTQYTGRRHSTTHARCEARGGASCEWLTQVLA